MELQDVYFENKLLIEFEEWGDYCVIIIEAAKKK
jgi:hypothetical protein